MSRLICIIIWLVVCSSHCKSQESVTEYHKRVNDSLYNRSLHEAERSVNDLIDSLQSNEPLERAAAAYWLGEKKVEKAIPLLITLLVDTTSVRGDYFWTLVRPRHGSTCPCQEAATAIGKIGGRGIDTLLNVFNSKELSSRSKKCLIKPLASSRDQRAMDLLIDTITDHNYVWYLRLASIEALGKIRYEPAIEIFIDSLDDNDKDIQRAAMRALHNVTNLPYKYDIDKWKTWWKEKADTARTIR